MNWDAVSAISSIIASVAVVLSLIYLSLQIRQSNKLSQSQTRTELRHMANTEAGRMIDKPSLQALWFKEEMNEEDRVQLYYYIVSALRFREFIWKQYNLELLDESTFQTYMKVVPWFLSTARNRRWWDAYKNTSYDPDFVIYVDRLLKDSPPLDIREVLDSF